MKLGVEVGEESLVFIIIWIQRREEYLNKERNGILHRTTGYRNS
jgi:hypothetical protein